MARKVPELEKLAQEEVGLVSSTLIFVNEEGVIRAVFTQRSDLNAAVEFAMSLPRKHAVWVEDYEGVAWENEESERRQSEED